MVLLGGESVEAVDDRDEYLLALDRDFLTNRLADSLNALVNHQEASVHRQENRRQVGDEEDEKGIADRGLKHAQRVQDLDEGSGQDKDDKSDNLEPLEESPGMKVHET